MPPPGPGRAPGAYCKVFYMDFRTLSFIALPWIWALLWDYFAMHFHVCCTTFSNMDFALLFHKFFIDFEMGLSLIFRGFCMQTSLHYQNSRTWILNDSIVF
jgi:hypothetical protein